jgi:outer membrane protein
MKAFLRKMILGLAGTIWFIVLVSGPGWAQSDRAALFDKPLSLRDCVRLALEQNPLQRAGVMGVAAAKEAVGEAKAPYYPEMGLQTGYHRWQTHAFLPDWVRFPAGSSTIVGPTNDWQAGLRARYTLFDSGERRALLDTGLARQGVAEEEKARITQEIILLVYQGFYGVLAAWEIRDVAEKNLGRTKDHLRLTKERKAAGAVPLADVLRAQVEVSNAELALVRAENLIRVSRGNLNTAMGLPVETILKVETRPGEIISTEKVDLDQAMEEAGRNRPEVRAVLQRIKASQGSVALAKSAFGPKLKAEGSYGWRDSEFLPQDEDWAVGLTIEWPLFTGFYRQHKLDRVKAELSKEEAEAKHLIQGIRQEVWTAHSRYREAYEAIQATIPLVRNAEESLRLARERYEVGAGTITDLLDAQTALARAQASQVEAEWDYFIAQAQFQRAAGRLRAEYLQKKD